MTAAVNLDEIVENYVIMGHMIGDKTETLIKGLEVYVYIDVSNIRWACLRSCGFNLDFIKLYGYLKGKYEFLKEVRYYEGIASGDKRKRHHFDFLAKEVGYTICALERKSYINPAKYIDFRCRQCAALNKVKTLEQCVKLKSNVDVYLASDMLELVATSSSPVHIILLSCDGDYTEAIKSVLRISPDSRVTVLATPITKQNNCLSIRLKNLSSELPKDHYTIDNIENIKDYISQPSLS